MIKEKLKQLNLATPIAVIGAGITGKSCFDLLCLADLDCVVFDESDTVSKHFTDNADVVKLGKFTTDSFTDYGTILLSPGVDTRRDCFADVQDNIITDIELFARLTDKELIGVTGSNGKSTVVSLLDNVCKTAKRQYILCGNIGLPVLQALRENEDNAKIEGYIIELSSYHLDNAPSLWLDIGVWLNVSPDHLDRYDSYDDYINSKANVFRQAEICVVNADDEMVFRYGYEQKYFDKLITYFSRKNNQFDWYYDAPYLVNEYEVFYGDEPHRIDKVFSMNDYPQIGGHHIDNLLAVFAVADLIDIESKFTKKACKNFKPLPARTAIVGEHNGITFVNDSKGTNIGATVAAINGIDRPIILLAGGQGKGQDFSELATACKNKVKHLLVFGQDADVIMQAMDNVAPEIACTKVDDLAAGVVTATVLAVSGDVVMLSPACASFDMFDGYIARGQAFEQ
ncbi:MAG: UDP-N-acetylmuramoyl-L-alanine--D-glutamate ligase, partial [Gammaproteobacteria bacterium]|nr:UDP-N-acetylmuramoyl-L-alanine--D-glutamate ligase [Gammaproteobacteria bacterium]